MTAMERVMYQVDDYPEPIAPLPKKQQTATFWQWRNRPEVRLESQRILHTHVMQNRKRT